MKEYLAEFVVFPIDLFSYIFIAQIHLNSSCHYQIYKPPLCRIPKNQGTFNDSLIILSCSDEHPQPVITYQDSLDEILEL